MQLLMISK